MKQLEYEVIAGIFNNRIFENSRIKLLKNLANFPERYIGLFRPTKPKSKIIQNITQSQEIKFGDAFEDFIGLILRYNHFKELGRNYTIRRENLKPKKISFDQLFEHEHNTIFIEQKIRDDHDSSKKVGQKDNFENKLSYLIDTGYKNIKSYFYFIDDSIKKKGTIEICVGKRFD